MVNVDGNFNRNYRRKRKEIRDKKRARIRGKKKLLGLNEESDRPKTKKEIKKEKRKEGILKAAGMTAEEVHQLVTYRKDKIRKNRRDKRKKRYIKTDNKEMDVEEEKK